MYIMNSKNALFMVIKKMEEIKKQILKVNKITKKVQLLKV